MEGSEGFISSNSLLCNVLGFLPLVGLLAIPLSMIYGAGYYALILILALQLALAYFFSCKYRNEINITETFCRGLDDIIEMVECINKEDFSSGLLGNMKQEMNSQADMLTGIRRLSKINEGFSLRRNVYVHILLQLFFMHDLQYINKLRKWKKIYRNNFKKLFGIIGEIEALLSLGVVVLNHEVCFPHMSESDKPVFAAEELYHPLIDTDKVVANSIETTKGINIISGSNMSGKSTFMRTVGINIVLAYAGAPVCAKSMKLSQMSIYTCMRVTDDVFMGKSSFYAEVLRIKSIVDAAKEQKPILAIIDEIFKGTNSIDRVTGAKEIVKQLDKSNVMLWVSTHDLEICSLIENGEVQGNNYHFMEHYDNKQILFDYKIKEGKCMSRNAKYILKMVGL